MAPLATSTIGYPRIGGNREIKGVIERYWKKQASQEELLSVANEVQAQAWQDQAGAGVNLVAADGTLYDQMLDTIYMLGIIPKRFQGKAGLDLLFSMARGAEGATALDMSKFMDTNYHYEVPELEPGWTCKPDFSHILDKVLRCQATIGKEKAVPMLMGPVSFVCLAKSLDGQPVAQSVAKLLPAYRELLKQLQGMGVPEVQVHEPYLATTQAEALQQECSQAFQELAAEGVPLNLVVAYDDVGETYPWLVQLPVAVISLDFLGVPGAAIPNRTLELIAHHGFPAGKVLGAGVIDGRSVWADSGVAPALISALVSLGVAPGSIRVQSSVSLQHLPIDLNKETKIPADLRPRLAFAQQKLGEIIRVAQAPLPAQGTAAAGTPAAAQLVQSVREQHCAKDTGLSVNMDQLNRSEPYTQRRAKQIQLRPFPTTSIGSFPQTPEIRRLRLQNKKGLLSDADYAKMIAGHIGFAIGLQEAMDIDVLVHGEPERTDMVEYFGQELNGMIFTEAGWVQSYGSRYVRPPIICGDVSFVKPITVDEFAIAQSMTSRPVKGMLTGPVTILNWSFPRVDITRKSQAFQLALALRQEVSSLEKAGCRVVQVDEPALREGLPLKANRWDGYLSWAVDAFRVTCTTAKPETQVVTHLCYSDFQDIMGAIDRMDADVLTIENSRSDDEMVRALANAKYGRDVGPGVYDVHSPVVPTVAFIKDKIRSFVSTGILGGDTKLIWVNPDCGLKTRGWAETIPSLRNMVQAAREMREELHGKDAVAECKAMAAKPGVVGGVRATSPGRVCQPVCSCCL